VDEGVGGGGGDLLCVPGTGTGMGIPNENQLLADLNNDIQLNATNLLNGQIMEDEFLNEFFNSKLDSKFYDLSLSA